MSKKNKKLIRETPPAKRIAGTSITWADIFKKDKWFILLIGLLAFSLYIASASNGYAIDDDLVTKDHQFVSKGISGIPEIFKHPFISTDRFRVDYRPLSQVTYAIERSLFGKDPGTSHIINTILYVLLCIALYVMIRRLFTFLSPSLVFLCMLIFTAHPLHSEVVNNLKCRDEIMSLLFGLGFLATALKFFETKKAMFWCLSVAFILLAFLSKLSATPLIFFLIAWCVYYRNVFKERQMLYALGSYIAVWLGYFVLVNWVLFPMNRPLTFTEFPIAEGATLQDRVGIIFSTIYFYLKMIVFPYPLNSYYGYNTIPSIPVWDPRALAVIIFFGLFAWRFIKEFPDRTFRSLVWLWFIISGFLYFNIVGKYAGIVSERAATLMSIPGAIGLVLLLGLAEKKDISVAGPGKITYALVILITAIFSWISFTRTDDWKNNEVLYAADLKHYPQSGHLNFLQGMNYADKVSLAEKEQRRQYVDSAALYFRRALEIYPDRPVSLTYLAKYDLDYFNRPDSAVALLNRAWRSEQSGEIAYEMGRALIMQDKWLDAIPWLEQSIRMDTSIYLSWYFLAQAKFQTGKAEEAFNINSTLLQWKGMQEHYYLNAGNFLGKQGKLEEAFAHLRKAVELGNRDSRVVQGLKEYYRQKGDARSVNWLDSL